MTTENLLHHLNDMILDYRKPVPYCMPEDGIHFLMPPPAASSRGMVFAGSFSDWEIACKNNLLYDECTYLICRENARQTTLPRILKPINLFLLDASVQTVLQRMTSILFGKSAADSLTVAQRYQNFWTDIMSLHLTTPKQVTDRIQDFPFPVHTYITCVVVRYSHPLQDNTSLPEIRQELQDFFPDTNLFFSEKEWIILYSSKENPSDHLDIPYDAFSNLLTQYDLDAGISYASRFPELLRTLYLTAAASIDLGKGLAIAPCQKRIYTYRQYNAYYVIHLCAQTFTELHGIDNLVYLTHPDIIRLYYYDQENNTNLLDVLYIYLSCEKNITQTSRLLYMHRNTIMNKLNKIKSVLHHDPDYDSNHFLLLLSCMIMKYQYSYTRRNVEDCFASRILEDS